ncbi:MAG TPA: hypothetical protein IAA61_06165 [Candidatus Ornithomonoglobus merdipullorum]|uniref:Uncharacterized protein n=1 Tax=Candidatus Ornithomonoglobus merdipullorum TaxID=2840895 RepID=A0A9D1SET7_9FIRM|nr:hypothetical protein [Candidatus Ornithomonoglobus merdipullorum]
MNKTKRVLSLLTSVAMAASAFSALVIPASAKDTPVEATLVHTASVQGGSNEAGVFVDQEQHYLNNWGTSGWVATGYTEFSIDSSITASKITNAELTFTTWASRGERTTDVALLDNTTASAIDFGNTETITLMSKPAENVITLSPITTTPTLQEVDVTDMVKSVLGNENTGRLVFAYANAAAGGYIYGMDASEELRPTLTLTVTDEAMYSVTVKCVDEEDNVIATSSEDVASGTEFTPTYENVIYNYEDGVKYTYASGGEAQTITQNTEIIVRYTTSDLDKYTVDVNAIGDVTQDITEVTGMEAQDVTYYVPKYIVQDGIAYETEANSSGAYYGATINAIDSSQTVEKTYTKAYENVVFFEDLDDTSAQNANLRASNGLAYDNKAYESEEEIQPGTYTMVIRIQDRGRGSTLTIGDQTVYTYDGTTRNAWRDVTVSDITVETAGKLALNAGGSGTYDDLDTIVIYSNTAVEPDPTPSESAEPEQPTEAVPTESAEPEQPTEAVQTESAEPEQPTEEAPTESTEPEQPTPVVVEKEGVIFEIEAPETDMTAVAVKATYDNGVLDTIAFENVEIAAGQTEVEIAAPEGTKVMLWNSLEDMEPLADAQIARKYTETVIPTPEPSATDTPATDTPATDEPTEPIESKVYLEDDFSSYTTTGVTTQGTAEQTAEMGNFIVHVGARTSGGDGVSTVTLENGALKIVSGNTATSSRGGSIALNTDVVDDVPAFADLQNGEVIDYSFKAMFTDSASTIQLFGITSNETTSGGDVVNDPYLSIANNSAIPVNEWVTVDVAVTNDKSGYLTIRNNAGAVIYSAAITASGDTFEKLACYGATSAVYVDDFKIETKAEAYGTIAVTVNTGDGEPLEGASVAFEGYTVLTDASGNASAVMPNGTYTVTASKSGYEHTEGMADNDSVSVTVNSDSQTKELTLSLMQYVALPEQVIIGGGQELVVAPKEAESAQSAAFTVDVIDQYGIEIPEDGYTLQWAIYPAGTTTADPNVTVENGVISVSRAFSTENKVAEYDLEVAAFTDDRNQKVTKTVYIANNDVIFYDPFNWTQPGGSGNRSAEQAFTSSVDVPDIVSVTMTVNFTTGTEGNANIALNSNAGKLVGLQLTSDNVIKAWTGWSGNTAMNQSGDVGAFAESAVIAEGYEKNTPLDVTFVIDTKNKQITVSCGTVTEALPYTIDATALTSVSFGQYRNYGGVTVTDVLMQEPDNNYLSIAGDFDFAKVSGQTITRTYELGQSVIVPDETFNWTVTPADQGVTIENGVISVVDTATAGEYTVTATSTINADKTATETVTIGDFQQLGEIVITGPRAIDTVGEKATYALAHATDSFGDDVTSMMTNIAWSSGNTAVADINSATGELTAKAEGTTEITATITNGTAVTTEKFDVTVGTYSLTGDASGASTTVDTSALVKGEAISEYLVTTADADGNEVKSTEVAAAEITDGSYDVDTTGAAKYEIAPIYSYDAGSPATLGSYTGAFRIDVPADTYNFVITANGGRCDVYANSQLLVNNILQGGSAVNSLAVNDIVVSEGYIDITTADYGTGASSSDTSISLTLVKAPSIVNRTQKMYVLGDSLVCIYYNGGNAQNNAQTGWGQVLQNYVNGVEVVDLGNSGVTANGLLGTAFTQVLQSAKEGDIMVLESGYNDRTYDTEEVMTNAVTSMVEQAEAKGVKVILVSPNASHHDYGSSVSWTRVMESVAADTETDYIDLAQMSYDFLYSRYGDAFAEGDTLNDLSRVYNVSDRLHSTYNGANMCASLIAQGLYDLGYTSIINTDYSYSFTDGLNQTVECTVTAE